MKTLANSCSKVIIDKPIERRFSYLSDLSSKLCLIPSKESFRTRFVHPLSVEHRRLQPIFTSPSYLSPESQVGLDLETPETEAGEENTSKTSHVKFQLQKKCSFGEQFFIVGDHPMLGSWDPKNAIPLNWSKGHVWSVELDVPVEKTIQFKFILKSSAGDLSWQPGPDRILKSWITQKPIIVCEDWENAEIQKLMEEDSLTNQVGAVLDSENLVHEKELIIS